MGASWTLAAVASMAGLGGLIFGYDLGMIGGALLGLSEDLDIHASIQQSSIVGALKLGSFIGAFVGGALMLRYGRRKAIAVCAFFSVLGPLVMASAGGVGALVAGRATSGIGVGACAIIVPAYLAEVAPASHRGAVVQVYEMMLCVGLLVSTLINWGLSHLGPSAWRVMVGLPAIPGSLLVCSLLLLPESPRWLVMRGQLDVALQTIHKILGNKGSAFPDMFGQDPAEIAQAEDELLLLWSSVEKDKHTVLERRQQLLERRRRKQGQPACVVDSAQPSRTESAVTAEDSLDPLLLKGGGPDRGSISSVGVQGGSPAHFNAPRVDSRGNLKWKTSDVSVKATTNDISDERLHAQQMRRLSQQRNDTANALQCQNAQGEQFTAQGENTHRPTAAQHSPMQLPSQAQLPSSRTNSSSQQGAPCLDTGQPHTTDQAHESAGSQELMATGSEGGTSLGDHSNDRGTGSRHRLDQSISSGYLCQGPPLPISTAAGVTESAAPAFGPGPQEQEALLQQAPRSDSLQPSTSLAEQPQQPQQPQQQQLEHSELPGQESNFFKTLLSMLVDIYAVARGREANAFRIACLLAVFNQATASTAIINYAPTLLQRLNGSLSDTEAQLFLATIALTKVLGVAIGMRAVDRLGRRPLLMWGAAGCAVFMTCATFAYQGDSALGLLGCMCGFVLAFSFSWAGVYWVIVSEVFSMGAKSPATSAATALMFLTGGLVDLLFKLLVDWLEGYCLLVFAFVALCSGVYVWALLPETKGKTLSEVQALINKEAGSKPDSSRESTELTSL